MSQGPDGAVAATTETAPRQSRRATVVAQIRRLIVAIRDGDEAMVESVVLTLSQRSRWLAPLGLIVGAFAMLFQGVKLLVTNWRLTLVQILPAMWIWAAMLDLKAHMFHGREFHVLRGPLLIPIVLVIASITAAAYFLNAVFAFAIARPGQPDIRPAYAETKRHAKTVLGWGFLIGIALGLSAMISQRWGLRWYSLCLGITVGIMMLTYVLIPSRLVGIKSDRSGRDKLAASAIAGAVGAIVCSPPYFLGRIALVMLGSQTLRVLAVVLLLVAVVLQTGANSAVKAVKMSAKLLTSPNSAPVAVPDEGS
jgi:hypothetical protein